MKGINTINMQRLNNGAHFTFVSNILARAEADGAVAARAAELVSRMKAAVEAEDEALNVSRKSFRTDDIAKANSDRVRLYRGYRRAVKAFLCMPGADMAEAAKTLAQHIRDYKIDPRDQLDKKTGMLVNFIDDLEGRHAAHVAKLGLTAFVTKMKEANEQVRTSTLLRTRERMGVVVGAMRKARAATDNAYRALVRMLNALAVVFGDAEYAPFIDYVNAEVTHYKREAIGQKAKASGTAASSGSEGADEGSAATNMESSGAAGRSTAANSGSEGAAGRSTATDSGNGGTDEGSAATDPGNGGTDEGSAATDSGNGGEAEGRAATNSKSKGAADGSAATDSGSKGTAEGSAATDSGNGGTAGGSPAADGASSSVDHDVGAA